MGDHAFDELVRTLQTAGAHVWLERAPESGRGSFINIYLPGKPEWGIQDRIRAIAKNLDITLSEMWNYIQDAFFIKGSCCYSNYQLLTPTALTNAEKLVEAMGDRGHQTTLPYPGLTGTTDLSYRMNHSEPTMRNIGASLDKWGKSPTSLS
jgi:hypothetical protein